MTADEITFLRESNNIEDEWDDVSLQDAILAWEYIKDQPELTIENILETHKLLMANRDTIEDKYKGQFRDGPVWIGGREGKPWFALEVIMPQWVAIVNSHVAFSDWDGHGGIWLPEEKEANCKEDHILYESNHAFFDGNGRTGRIFYNWERLRMGLPIDIIWESEKQDYYEWFK